VIAFLFLSSSVLVDVIFPPYSVQFFIEDSLKFFGIVFWLGYFFHATSTVLRGSLNPK
jgi:hypothetical protein